MKEFVKYTLATVVGIILVGVIVSIIGTMAIVGIIAAGKTTTTVHENSVVVLNLSGAVTERVDESSLSYLASRKFRPGLKEIISTIQKAKENENIKGIYLKAGALSASPATLQEIRNALLDFKESGKFIVSYGDFYTQGNYYLCSVADKMMLNPKGTIDWSGLSGGTIYMKDMYDKLGIEIQVFKVGTYKSAVEPLISNTMSEANREQTSAYLGSIWNQLLEGVSQSRNLSKDTLNAYADRPVTLCETSDYLTLGMVDTLLYQTDIKAYLLQQLGLDKEDELNTLSPEEMMSVEMSEAGKKGESIAVYYAEGGIDGTSLLGSETGIISSKMCKTLKKLREDDDIKAVVLRINSPGGSAYGSEQIWREVVELKKEKPVIVSMGGYAASGGYYIACAANRIVADPTTLTGSIGIFATIPNTQKLMSEKIGWHMNTVNTNKFSDIGSTFRPMSNEEKAIMQAEINRGYELFITRCADGRGMTKEAIKQIAEGRVWTGERAKELGLVDELGDLSRAIEIAAQEAGLTDYTLFDYPEPENIFNSLLNLKDDYVNAKIQEMLGEYGRQLFFIRQIEKQDRVQARLPYEIQFNL